MKKYIVLIAVLLITGCSTAKVIEPVVEKSCGFPLKYFTDCK